MVGQAKPLVCSVEVPVRCGAGSKRPSSRATPRNHQRHHQQQVGLHRKPGLRDASRDHAGRKEAEAPEGMAAIHDAVADEVLGAIGLEVQDDLDAADGDADRQQQHEEGERPGGEARNGVEQCQQRNEGEDGAAIADPFEPRPGKAQRDQRANGGADEPEAERPLLHAHGALDVGQTRRQAPHAERVDEKAAINPLLRRQLEPDSHGGR